MWLYRTRGRVSYSWSTTSSIPLLSSAPRQPLNMNDTFKISSIIILAIVGSIIQRALDLGSYQACNSWLPQPSSLMATVADCRRPVQTVDLKSTGTAVGCYGLICAGMTVETHGDGVGWDGRRCTWQAGDVIINLVLYFVPHSISKIK